jgi:hypothetical protein
MPNWHVSMEWTADPHTAPEAVTDRLLLELSEYNVGVVNPPGPLSRWATSFSLAAPTIRQASGLALTLITSATHAAGQQSVTVVSLDIANDAVRQSRP